MEKPHLNRTPFWVSSSVSPEDMIIGNFGPGSGHLDSMDPNQTDQDNLTETSLPGCPFGNCSGPGFMMGKNNIRYFTLFFYMTTFIVGILGNSLVIYILIRFSEVRVKSVANYYILNLALADLIFILTLPMFCYLTFTKNWIFGNPTCKIMYVFREINKFGSVFTLAALSVDRYIASFHNLGHLRTITVGKCVCVCIWLGSLAMCTPFLMYAYAIPTTNGGYSCKINWPRSNTLLHESSWTYSQLLLGLVVPFIIISLSYVFLLRRLKAIMKPRSSNRNAERIRKPNRKMTKTILVVFIIFIICQVPYYIMDLIRVKRMEHIHEAGGKYIPTKMQYEAYMYSQAISQILVFISSCCNPVIYGILNENYRKLYQMALGHGGSRRTPPRLILNGDRRRSSCSFRNNNVETLLHNNGSGKRESNFLTVHTELGPSTGSTPNLSNREVSSFV